MTNNTTEIIDGGGGHNFSLHLFQREGTVDWIVENTRGQEMFCEIIQHLKYSKTIFSRKSQVLQILGINLDQIQHCDS